MVFGDNGILKIAQDSKEETRAGIVQDERDIWKGNQKINQYAPSSKGETLEEILTRLVSQGNLTEEEKQTVKETGQVTIGTKTIVFEEDQTTAKKEPTPVFVKLYTDETLIFSSFDYTDPNREVQEDYGEIPTRLDENEFWPWQESENCGWGNFVIRAKGNNIIIYDEIVPLDTSGWFAGISDHIGDFTDDYAITLDLKNLNTSNVESMRDMFVVESGGYSPASVLQSLNISHFDTSRVKDMKWMFSGCDKLTTLDISGWDVRNVTNMSGMFIECNSLTTLDVSGWDVSNVTDMSNMFSYCTGLTTLDISSWEISGETSVESMFIQCNKLTTVYVKNEEMAERFRACAVDYAGEPLPIQFIVK